MHAPGSWSDLSTNIINIHSPPVPPRPSVPGSSTYLRPDTFGQDPIIYNNPVVNDPGRTFDPALFFCFPYSPQPPFLAYPPPFSLPVSTSAAYDVKEIERHIFALLRGSEYIEKQDNDAEPGDTESVENQVDLHNEERSALTEDIETGILVQDEERPRSRRMNKTSSPIKQQWIAKGKKRSRFSTNKYKRAAECRG